MPLHDLLKSMIALEASDLFLTVGAPPSVKLFGELKALEGQALTPESSPTAHREAETAKAHRG